MSEVFTVTCANVAVSAAQDILCAYAASTKKLKLLAVELAANGQTTVGNYNIRLVHLVATVTAGSGGTTPTPHNVNPGAAAPSFTAHANDTTQATASTTINVVASQFNPINGYYWQPPFREAEPLATLSDAFSLSLDAVSGTINVSATMWLEEI